MAITQSLMRVGFLEVPKKTYAPRGEAGMLIGWILVYKIRREIRISVGATNSRKESLSLSCVDHGFEL